ncbi:hypothetical protein M1466_03025 [Candidatus Dependentiae bacterium]|nr:hypothetical protein [Candidatus Dependentiae bacterium]
MQRVTATADIHWADGDHDALMAAQKVHRGVETTQQQAGYKTLKNRLIATMDGVSFMLDWKAMRDMFKVRLKVNERLHGKLDVETKKRIGVIEYDGNHYSIAQLAQLEREKQLSQEQLELLLTTAKKDFLDTVNPFMAKMHRTKTLVMELMKESCQIRNIPDSFLLSWTKTNGNENEVFHAGIKSFAALEKFCIELNNFLGDLIHSCPKALHEYKQRVAAGTHTQQ